MATVSDLKAAGKDGLKIHCPGCGCIVIHWWRTLCVPDSVEISSIIRRLRCKRCGSRPTEAGVTPYRRIDHLPNITKL